MKILLLIILPVALYLPALQYEFVYDDSFQVVGNKWITDVKYLPEIFSSSVWAFEPRYNDNIYRPLQHVVYMLEYHLFGLNPWGFHLVNILIHTGNTILVYFLATAIFTNRHKFNPSFPAALLFAMHPVNTEPVAWIGAIPELCMALFFLLSLYFYITCPPGLSKKFVFSVIFFSLAILFKETALTLLFAILLYDYAKKGLAVVIKGHKRYLPFILVSAGYMLLRFFVLGGITVDKKMEISAGALIINTFPLFFQYMQKLLLPFDLKAIYVFYPVDSLTEPGVAASIVFAMLFLIGWYISKTKDKTVFIGISFMVIPLIPVFYLPAIRDYVFADRYLYLPCFGFALLLAYSLERIYIFFTERRPGPALTAGRMIILTLPLIIFFGLTTIKRHPVWKDDLSLWSDTVRKSPDSFKAQNNLGLVLGGLGKNREAIVHFSEALRIRPDFADAYNNYGIALFGLGKVEQAMDYFTRALKIKTNFAEPHYNLGFVLTRQGEFENALFHFREALKIKPDYQKARYQLEQVMKR